MKIGRNMRTLMTALETFGHVHGRPPGRAELTELVELTPQAMTYALQRLADAGHLQHTGGGHYVLVRTLDGRPVTCAQTVGPVEGAS